jgi:hypothetical protein
VESRSFQHAQEIPMIRRALSLAVAAAALTTAD